MQSLRLCTRGRGLLVSTRSTTNYSYAAPSYYSSLFYFRASFSTQPSSTPKTPPKLPPPKNNNQKPSNSQHHPPHKLNIASALKRADEGHYFHELPDQPVTALQGIGPKHADWLETLGIHTIQQLADYKFFHLARSIDTLANIGNAEEPDGRLDHAVMNVDKGLDKAFQHWYFREILELPVSALSGISDEKGAVWKSLGCKTVRDLAHFKYCQWSEAICTAAKFEQKATATAVTAADAAATDAVTPVVASDNKEEE